MNIGTIKIHGTDESSRINLDIDDVIAQDGHTEISFDILFLSPNLEPYGDVKGVAGYRGKTTLYYKTFEIITATYDSNTDEFQDQYNDLLTVLKKPYSYLEIINYYPSELPFPIETGVPVSVALNSIDNSSGQKSFTLGASSVVPNQW